MHMEVESPDLDALIAKFMQAGPALDTAVRSATSLVSAMAKAELVGPEGLSKFPAHSPRTKTTASPGGPPAQVTGRLLGSATELPISQTGPAQFVGGVGVSTFYAAIVEKGSGPRPAYPFMRRVRNQLLHSNRIRQVYRIAILNALHQGR